MTFTNPDQIDVVNTAATGDIARYNRDLIVGIWYPATAETQPGGILTALVRDRVTEPVLTG